MIITKTPLRISFLGGNTDLPEYYSKYRGLVLTTTIDKYIYCIVKKRFDDLIIVNYSKKETVADVDLLDHELVRESLKLVGVTKGIEITFLADIPSQGTGLGSSSAVTIGVLSALHTYLGENVNSEQLANEAIEIELNRLKKPIGIQDQCSIAVGGLMSFEFYHDNDLRHIKGSEIKLNDSLREDFNNSLMLFYTGITRKTEDILGEFEVEENKLLLDSNKILTQHGINSLIAGDLKGFGDTLECYWENKKFMNKKVSTPEIDEMYKKAKVAGAIGGKIIGAGAGGFLLVMFPANKRAVITEALKDYNELPFRFEKGGTKVLLNI